MERRHEDDRPRITALWNAALAKSFAVRVARPRLAPPFRRLSLLSFPRNEERDRALRVGFDAQVAKPYEPEQLLAAIVTVSATRT